MYSNVDFLRLHNLNCGIGGSNGSKEGIQGEFNLGDVITLESSGTVSDFLDVGRAIYNVSNTEWIGLDYTSSNVRMYLYNDTDKTATLLYSASSSVLSNQNCIAFKYVLNNVTYYIWGKYIFDENWQLIDTLSHKLSLNKNNNTLYYGYVWSSSNGWYIYSYNPSTKTSTKLQSISLSTNLNVSKHHNEDIVMDFIGNCVGLLYCNVDGGTSGADSSQCFALLDVVTGKIKIMKTDVTKYRINTTDKPRLFYNKYNKKAYMWYCGIKTGSNSSSYNWGFYEISNIDNIENAVCNNYFSSTDYDYTSSSYAVRAYWLPIPIAMTTNNTVDSIIMCETLHNELKYIVMNKNGLVCKSRVLPLLSKSTYLKAITNNYIIFGNSSTSAIARFKYK